MDNCWRKKCFFLLLLSLVWFGSSCLAAPAKQGVTIEVVSMHANKPKKFSEQQCLDVFTPDLFTVLERAPEKQAIQTPDGVLTIGPRTRRILNLSQAKDKHLLVYFTSTFSDPTKESSKSNKKPKKKKARKKKGSKNKGKTFPSYLIAPLDKASLGFLSTVYCDAVLERHDAGDNRKNGGKK